VNPLEFGFDFVQVGSTSLVRTGACVLHTITVNRLDAGTCVASVYDGIDGTGTLIATIDLGVTDVVDLLVATLILDVRCTTGIYVALTGSPTTASLTVTFR